MPTPPPHQPATPPLPRDVTPATTVPHAPLVAPRPATPAAASRPWSARLPFAVIIGPYRVAVELRPRGAMDDGRRRTCVNLEAHRLELRHDLRGLPLAAAFLEGVVRLAHFSKGCQQGCIEEAYAHSFATGMMEFAQRNPRAWLWFNLLLSQSLAGAPRHDRTVRGVLRAEPRMPRRLLVCGEPVTVRVISRRASGNAFGWYDFAQREVQLCAGLEGCHLPIVALHELTHAVHHAQGLEDHAPHQSFLRAQVAGWIGIMRDNPLAWRWLAWAMSFPARARIGPVWMG